MVSALALKFGIKAQSHSGLKNQFNLHFIKTGIIPIAMGKLYSDLMDWRQRGDYGDMFDFDKEPVEELFKPVEEFLNCVRHLI